MPYLKSIAYMKTKMFLENIIMRHRSMKYIYFTIIELLIVISIMSILTCILLPSLSKARGAAKGIKCLGNLKQLGQALSFYTDDHNGFFPPSKEANPPDYHWRLWFLGEYLGNSNAEARTVAKAGVFWCPEDIYREKLKKPGYSYGYNSYIGLYRDPAEYSYAAYTAKYSIWNNRSKVLLYSDSHRETGSRVGVTSTMWPLSLTAGNSVTDQYVPVWHNNRANIIYMDLHALSRSASNLANETLDGYIISGKNW